MGRSRGKRYLPGATGPVGRAVGKDGHQQRFCLWQKPVLSILWSQEILLFGTSVGVVKVCSAMHLVTASWPGPTSSFGLCLYDHCLVMRRQTHTPFHSQRLCPLCVVCGGQGAVVCLSLLSNLLCSPGRQWRAIGYFEE